jgi:broad specificity phosphatase PhoE
MRARDTAQAIASRHGLTVQTDTALREVNYGQWEGLGDAELLRDWAEHWQRRVADPLNVAPPGGESYADLWRRLQPVWDAIVERHQGQSVAIVGHNGSLRILLCHLLGAPLGNARHIRLMNTSVSCIEYEDSALESGAARFVISSINDTCHLAGI